MTGWFCCFTETHAFVFTIVANEGEIDKPVSPFLEYMNRRLLRLPSSITSINFRHSCFLMKIVTEQRGKEDLFNTNLSSDFLESLKEGCRIIKNSKSRGNFSFLLFYGRMYINMLGIERQKER